MLLSRGKEIYLQAHIAKFTQFPHVIVNGLGNGYFCTECQICTILNKYKLISRTAVTVFLAFLFHGCWVTGAVSIQCFT